MDRTLVVPLKDARDTLVVGGKAASLGELMRARLTVPNGFVVTTTAFGQLNSKLEAEVLKNFDDLGANKVAVRSSAVAEDSKLASWAGQLETSLNVGRSGLIEAIKKCWQSVESERAREYARENNVKESELKVAVVIQEMVDAQAAGVAFSVHPVTQDRSQIVVEAVRGLGEQLVSGMVTPDTYVLTKQNSVVLEKNLSGKQPILNEKMLAIVAKQIRKIEDYYGFGVDVEWAFSEGQLFILQSRPITTLEPETTNNLPGFFGHCVLALARPASVQRDELVCLTANAVCPVEVASLPLEGNNRAYYFEAEAAKRLLAKCTSSVDSKTKLKKHLADYQLIKKAATKLCQQFESNSSDYSTNINAYRNFLTDLSWFLYVGVAVDKIIYPGFKQKIEELYPKCRDKILEIVEIG